jgi:nucleotide-binding universal stress UspA family protein
MTNASCRGAPAVPSVMGMSSGAQLGIVAAVDDSTASGAALRWATREAGLRHIPLTLVHAISPELATGVDVPALPPGLARWQHDHGRKLLNDGVKTAERACAAHGPTEIHTELLACSAVPALVDLSKDAELIVAGARGSRRWAGRLLGSVSSGLLRHAHCPVAVIHDEVDDSAAGAPVLVGIDGSPASEPATAIAFDAASRRNVDLIALHAWSDADVSEWPGIDWPGSQPMAEQVLAERLAGWQERYPDVAVHRVVVCDQPARQLVAHSAEAQLVVVGSRGRGGFAGMLVGSVGESVAQLVRVPVIVARRDDTMADYAPSTSANTP